MRRIPFACNLDCGAGCALIAEYENNKILRVTENPLAGEYLAGCIRGYQIDRAQHAQDRLTKPLIRTGPRGSGEYKETTWDEALDYVASNLLKIREQYGPEAVLHLGGSGASRGTLHNTKNTVVRFLSLYGGYTGRFFSYSTAATTYATPFVLGTNQAGVDADSLENSKLIILWGANVVDNRFGSLLEKRLRELKSRGVKIIVVEPRRTRTVKTLGTDWVQVYPGTDSALMLAVLYELLRNDLVQRDYIEKYSFGFNRLEEYVTGEIDGVPKTPEWAEAICGTPSNRIRWLAKLYGETHPTALIPGLSIQRTLGGEEAVRLSVALQTATGNIGVTGGSSGTYISTLPGPAMGSLPMPENPKGIEVPTYTWPHAVLEGKAGGFPSDIKAVYNVGGNYLNQGSDIKLNIKAFESLEFSVCHERFLTPTALYCDVVLPVTTFLERDDIIRGGGNFILYSNKVYDPISDVKSDYEIFCLLSERMGFGDAYSEGRTMDGWLRKFVEDSEVPDYEEFKQNGIHLGLDQKRTAFSDFIEDPDKYPLNTPSGKIQISSETYARTGGSAFPVYKPVSLSEEYPLRMITPKSRYRINSTNYNIAWFREREEQALWIHPVDAEKRGITEGKQVLISSPQGAVLIEAHVTEDMMEGVVCLLEGAWMRFNDEGVEVNGSVNVLTSTVPTLPSHGSRTHSVNVQVQLA
ncbi:MAG: molybdopterin-dependent oxidoreductase [Candidatus Bathyarchaeota archaeon]|nr:molybdopterin-dependent oxidoreductase [Candidatus Bathyarchaeota archaeon]